MNRIENYSELETRIVSWLKDYAEQFNIKAFVIGVSGGIDSAVSSTLAAKTGLPVYALGMPIYQKEEQETLSDTHLEWLQSNFDNVFKSTLMPSISEDLASTLVPRIMVPCASSNTCSPISLPSVLYQFIPFL